MTHHCAPNSIGGTEACVNIVAAVRVGGRDGGVVDVVRRGAGRDGSHAGRRELVGGGGGSCLLRRGSNGRSREGSEDEEGVPGDGAGGHVYFAE